MDYSSRDELCAPIHSHLQPCIPLVILFKIADDLSAVRSVRKLSIFIIKAVRQYVSGASVIERLENHYGKENKWKRFIGRLCAFHPEGQLILRRIAKEIFEAVQFCSYEMPLKRNQALL
jgi:hypothetical protein